MGSEFDNADDKSDQDPLDKRKKEKKGESI